MLPDTERHRDCAFYGQACTIGTVLTDPFRALPDPDSTARPAANDDTRPTFATRFAQGAAMPFGRLAAAAQACVTHIKRWRDRQILRETLLAMDHHQLADIGLTRTDIPAVLDNRFVRYDDRR